MSDKPFRNRLRHGLQEASPQSVCSGVAQIGLESAKCGLSQIVSHSFRRLRRSCFWSCGFEATRTAIFLLHSTARAIAGASRQNLASLLLNWRRRSRPAFSADGYISGRRFRADLQTGEVCWDSTFIPVRCAISCCFRRAECGVSRLPHPFLLFVAAIPLGVWLASHRRDALLRVRRRSGLCINCGYDLRGSHGRCSECGMPCLTLRAPAPAQVN